MKNKSFFAGLIMGLLCSIVFAAITQMNAASVKEPGRYQIAVTTVKAMNGYESIAEVILDTDSGVIVSRSQKDFFSDYKK